MSHDSGAGGKTTKGPCHIEFTVWIVGNGIINSHL